MDPTLFPWTAEDVRTLLEGCPPDAFVLTGVRLERLPDGAWWGDLTAWRADTASPVVWPGFRLRRRAQSWSVEFPPYLAPLDPTWRVAVVDALAGVATRQLDDRAGAAGVLVVRFDAPPGAPGPDPVGDDRITPGHTFTAIWLHHAKRYRFAATLAAGRRVLDLGCGVGYGSRMLARTAREVVALDVSEAALGYAARAYRSPRVRLLAGDARRLPLAARSVELVVCFEMIEHVREHALVLDEVIRVLVPNGRLAISTPNPRFYAPDAHHVGLLAREAFARVLRERFAEVELWSQPRAAGLVEITEEFEPRPGADEGAEMFLAVAARPRTPRPAVVVAGPAGCAPAGAAESARAAAGAPRVLAFNWHEPYLALLARTGAAWSVATWHRPWNRAYRPVPASVRLVDDPEEARTLIEDRRVDLVLCQAPDDLAWLGDRPIPVVYLAHNSLANETRVAPPGTAEALRERVGRRLARHGGLFVAISDMKLASWGLPGRVVPPGVDPGEYTGWTGEAAAALTVGNLLAERDHMLGYSALAAALAGLPWRILGTNPTLGVREAPDWDALRAAYRTHRCYAHATRWPWEDGWNLALLEAMATGMPVVTWTHPTSPIRPGLEGFLADDAEDFRRWVRRLLDDPELAARLGARARARALACFPLDAFVARWQTVLAQAADPARRAWPGCALTAPETTAPARSGEARAPDTDPEAETPPGTVGPAATTPAAVGASSAPIALAPAAPALLARRADAPATRRQLRVVLASAWTPISTAAYYARAFRAAGHDVRTWGPTLDDHTLAQWQAAHAAHALKPPGHDARMLALLRALRRPADLPAPPGQPSARTLLDRLPRGWRPDLFVWIDGGPDFLPLDLEALDCPTVALLGDTHTQRDWRLAYARHVDHAFVTFNRAHAPLVRDRHGRPARWLPAACDPAVHRPFDVEPVFDVVFVGQTHRHWHPDRVRLLERLAAAGLRLWVGTEILDEMALTFCRGRLVFNRSLAGDLNMRVFEALATGRCLLTDRLPPEAGLAELLTDRVHLVCYGEDDLEALARYYLDHPAEREAIARQGRAEVLRRHTYRHRVATLLAAVLGPHAEPAGPLPAAPTGAAPTSPPDAAALPAYYRHERPELLALVPPTARRVLDVGCGAGGLGRALKRRGPCHVVGIEAHPAAAAAARTVLDQVLEADIETLDPLPFAPGTFDCIVCADVLEHLREPARLLARLRPLLAPHGVLVASLPNVRHASVLLPLLVDGRWRYQDEGILDRTHLRFFTRAELDALLAEAGFRLTSLGATVTPEHPLTARLAALVAQAGGDPTRFRDETRVVQYLLTAVPAPTPAPHPGAPDAAGAAPADAPTPGDPAAGTSTATAPRPAPAAPEPAPAVSIVIPVCNQAALTARCLAALARTVDPTQVEVLVVDNGSTDATPTVLAHAPLPLRVLRNPDNRGFARAANQGARAARAPLLVFLNNDTEPEPGWLDALRAAAADPSVGLVGAKLLYPGTRRLQHAGLALTPEGLPDHLWRHAPEDDPRAAQPRDLDMVTGACLAIRRDLFLRLGGFDEAYQNGCEDVDLCLAVRALGLRVRYEPRAVVLHHEGATPGRFAHVAQNLARLHAKWGPQLAALPRLPAEEFGTLPGPPIAWEGSFFVHHSLAGINRAVCRELLARGIDLTLTPYEPDEFDPAATPDTAALARLVDRPTKTPPVLRVRHRFPPDFTRRPGERLVLIQPWEFGAVPVEWVRGIVEQVDELWVPSEWVRQCFVAGGVPPERVVTIPNGFDPAVFRPDAPPLPLPTSKTFRFLYVGGSIHRKGYDLLLRAYVETFTAADDVCLVIKDHAYYRHRLDATLEELRRPGAPEVLYYFDNVAPAQMAGFYAAATCLVHPFRGEGFGLPILEAMACGRAVIVTDAGPVREFCPPDVGIFVPARRMPFPECRVDHLETVGRPFLVEPDLDALRTALRWAYEHREECLERGARGAAHAHAHYPWPVIAGRYAARIEALLAGSTSPEPERLLAGAARLLEAGRVREALPRFAAAIRLDPECVPALVGAAHCALSLDEPAAARALLTRILALDPDNAPARAALAQLDAGAPGGTEPRGPDPVAGAATPQAEGAR